MRPLILLAALAATACGPVHFRPTDSSANINQVDFDRASYECQMQVNQAARGRSVSGGILFVAIVAASNAAADRALYKSCMAARGYTEVEAKT